MRVIRMIRASLTINFYLSYSHSTYLIYSPLDLIIFIFGHFIGQSCRTLPINFKSLRASNHTTHCFAPSSFQLLSALLPLPLQHCNFVHQCTQSIVRQCSPLFAIATTSYSAKIILYLTYGCSTLFNLQPFSFNYFYWPFYRRVPVDSKPLTASNHTVDYSAPYTLPLLFALLPLPLQHCNSVHQCSPLLAIATTASYFAAILEPCCITSLLYLTNGVHLRQGSWLLDFRGRMSVSFCTKLIFEESGSILRVVFYHKSITLIL